MTAKKRFVAVASRRQIPPFVSKFVISLLILFCFVAFLGLFSQFKLQSSTVPNGFYFDDFRLEDYRMKIAFLFLVRDNLPLDFLWHNFFKIPRISQFTYTRSLVLCLMSQLQDQSSSTTDSWKTVWRWVGVSQL